MKKILIAVAENKLPQGAFEFIEQLNEINPVMVTGVFLREIVYNPEPALSYYGGMGVSGCGQAPSDFPEFALFLVEEGIKSISFNADALLKGIENINKAEKSLQLPA